MKDLQNIHENYGDVLDLFYVVIPCGHNNMELNSNKLLLPKN